MGPHAPPYAFACMLICWFSHNIQQRKIEREREWGGGGGGGGGGGSGGGGGKEKRKEVKK